MDRFIAKTRKWGVNISDSFKIQYGQIYRVSMGMIHYVKFYLKSNMDRFIGRSYDIVY